VKGSLIVLAFFSAGIGFGWSGWLPETVLKAELSSYALYLLMFLVGVGIGADKHILEIVKKLDFKIVLVPIVVVIGTLGGVALVSLVVPNLQFAESLAIGSGFGYYSLSSIILTKTSGETIGVIALISNIIREVSTLLLAPIYVQYFGKLAPIAAGGATSMDTCLPVVVQYSGKEYAIISLFSGIVLTILVPFLVTFIIQTL
jgi:uncharacterized membrane protein YbjE (DUF340 family)